MDQIVEKKFYFMRIAIEEAKAAFKKGEIPVGAVLVKDDNIIAKAHNINRSMQNPLMHAEMICIEKASQVLNNERLLDCELYVTKEPCVMCSGAIVHARIKSVIIGTEDVKSGACGTALEVCGNDKLNHRPDIEFGIMREEAAGLLSEFFQNLRKK